MLRDTEVGVAVAARLEEFWGHSTPWHRRLWGVGTVAALKEVIEVSTAVSESVLREGSLQRLQSEAERLAGQDPGVGDEHMKRTLQRILKGDLTAGRVAWRKLSEIIPRIEGGYLQRWASAAEGLKRDDQERAARYIAGHLLEAGFAATYLHRWLTYRTRFDLREVTLTEILKEADADQVRREDERFEVVIPCVSVPRVDAGSPPAEWRSSTEIARLLRDLGQDTTNIRQNGGFAIEVTVRDPYAAVEQARELLDRWAARVELATTGSLTPTKHAWVEGVSRGIPFDVERRQVDVGALERETRLYAPLDNSETAIRLDDAFQLAQPLARGPRAAAIGGGWAALESLLTAPGEGRGVAASRLAAVVACSFPRAELTTLSYEHQKHASDNLAQKLSSETENLARARLMAEAILTGEAVHGRGPNDDAARDRMAQVLERPAGTLGRVRSYLEGALTRLYRERNLTLHGGRVSGGGRTTALRTSPPLVGAGLDRLAHAWFVEETSPLDLVARAELNLELAGATGAPTVVELLEQQAV